MTRALATHQQFYQEVAQLCNFHRQASDGVKLAICHLKWVRHSNSDNLSFTKLHFKLLNFFFIILTRDF